MRIGYLSPWALFVFCLVTVSAGPLSAQQSVPAPNRDKLFIEDTKGAERKLKKDQKALYTTDRGNDSEIDVKAASVEYLKETNQVKGDGGLFISRDGVQVQADSGVVNMETKDAELNGHLLIGGMESVISSDSGNFNLETEQGTFVDGTVLLEQGGYRLGAKTVDKISEYQYKLFDSKLTTCGCTDGESPWSIDSDSAHVTQEGYAHTYNTTLKMYGVPFLYTPYLAFPVKSERSSGLLVPKFGVSSEDGFQFSQPIFGVIDDSTDITFTPFIETDTRAGAKLDFRKIFSRQSTLASRFVYSNESARGSDLKGSNVDDLDDPTIDTNRTGGFLKQYWRNQAGSEVSLSTVTDLHYVSDDLFLREMEDPDIGEAESRYTTSRALVRGQFGDHVYAEGGLEYNQALVSPDEETLQRLPGVRVTGQKSFRPFGFNPYGIKVVSANSITSTTFSRDEGFDGSRQDLFPSLRVPFHIQNYVNGQLEASSHQTFYQMDDSRDVDSGDEEDFDTSRSVYSFSYQMQTALERVYELEENNSLSWLTSIGKEDSEDKLVRVKHVIEPTIKYTFVPDTTQEDLPLYDELDRIRERSLVTYGFRTALYGRFTPASGVREGEIPELTPRIEDLPLFSESTDVADIGFGGMFTDRYGNISSRIGEIRELAEVVVRQSYDYKEDYEDNDPDRSPYSDVYGEVSLYPTSQLGFRYDTNYDVEETNPSSWGFSTILQDDRGDSVIARYSYNEDSISQIEGNIELSLSDRIKIGYYARFDDLDSEFLVNKLALRFKDHCKCWYVDVGVSDKVNPDKQTAFVTLTLAGLGDFTQKFGVSPSASE